MKMIKHFYTITKHRHIVLRNAAHMGIFFFALHHDLSKYNPVEFFPSSKYFVGRYSPVLNQRKHEEYFSPICQHHTRRNPHHWEYWTDFFNGYLLMKQMPYKWATEFVCDTLSASQVYNKDAFERDTTLNYFLKHSPHMYMNSGTKQYIIWCLTQYKETGWEHLGRKETKAKYDEIMQLYPRVEIIDKLNPGMPIKEVFEKIN